MKHHCPVIVQYVELERLADEWNARDPEVARALRDVLDLLEPKLTRREQELLHELKHGP